MIMCDTIVDEVCVYHNLKLNSIVSFIFNLQNAVDAMTEEIIYPKNYCYFASVCAVLFCIFGVSGKSHIKTDKRIIFHLLMLPGNFLTIVALLRCERLRKHATTAFLLSLTVSDFLVKTKII